MKNDLKLIAGMLKAKLHKATMSQAQKNLYDEVGKTMTSDAVKQETTLTIPANANPADVKKVKRQFEIEAGWKINFVDAPSAPASGANNPKPPVP